LNRERGRWRKEKGAPIGGAPVLANVGKRKEEREMQAAAGKGGMGRWAAGPKEREVRFSLFSLFLFKSFSNQTI
jgi:hypothetical protein